MKFTNMKRLFFFFFSMVLALTASAQSVMEDKDAIRDICAKFSILSDQKDGLTQALLFTEDAEVTTYIGENPMMTLKGREQIGQVFHNFINTQETLFHHNGQHLIEVNGDKANGTLYCFVTTIAKQNDQRMMTQQGVWYDDEYVKIEGKWYISKRASHFTFTDVRQLPSLPQMNN